MSAAEQSLDEQVSTAAAVDRWLARLAGRGGAPGGGEACGVLLGVAASLLHMVALYSPDPEGTGAELVGLRRAALAEAEEDGRLSAALGDALGAEENDPGRADRVVATTTDAAESSVRLGILGIRLAAELDALREVANPHVHADLVVAAETLAAALGGILANLRGDLALLERYAPGPGAGIAALGSAALRLARVRARVRATADRLHGD